MRKKGDEHTGSKRLMDRNTLSRAVELDRMRQIARMLVKGSSIKEAFTKAGISKATFWRWQKDPSWSEIYRETSEMLNARMDEALAQNVAGRMKLAAEKALVIQERLLDDPDTPIAIRARISDSLMDRDDRMSKKRQLSVKHGHEILNPEVLALAAATAQAMLAAQQKPEEAPIIEAEVISEVKEEETAV